MNFLTRKRKNFHKGWELGGNVDKNEFHYLTSSLSSLSSTVKSCFCLFRKPHDIWESSPVLHTFQNHLEHLPSFLLSTSLIVHPFLQKWKCFFFFSPLSGLLFLCFWVLPFYLSSLVICSGIYVQTKLHIQHSLK